MATTDNELLVHVSGDDVAEMMERAAPFLDRMMRSFDEEDYAALLMATAAWGVYQLGSAFGEDVARDFAQTMAEKAHEITTLELDQEYDA